MIIGRIASGILRHFPTRGGEWGLAFILLLWGLNASFTPGYFDRPVWLMLRELAPGSPDVLAPELFWGSAATLIAALRIMALIVNGTFADTIWSRYSPHVRTAMAVLSCFFWTTQVMSVWSSSYLWLGVSAPAVYLAGELWIIVRTSSDARHSDEAHYVGCRS